MLYRYLMFSAGAFEIRRKCEMKSFSFTKNYSGWHVHTHIQKLRSYLSQKGNFEVRRIRSRYKRRNNTYLLFQPHYNTSNNNVYTYTVAVLQRY